MLVNDNQTVRTINAIADAMAERAYIALAGWFNARHSRRAIRAMVAQLVQSGAVK